MKFIRVKTQRTLFSLIALLAVLFWALPASAASAASPDPTPNIYNPLPGGELPTQPIDSDLMQLSAQTWVMVNGANGKVLSSKDPDRRMYPASMTKMMTCILAIESGRLEDTITISRRAAATPCAHVTAGYRYILGDLLYDMMLRSDNGAATAVAEFLGNDSVPFTDLMNAKAAELGMNGTHFSNPHGLHQADNYSTAADIMRLALYCMRNPTFAKIVGTADYSMVAVYPAGRTMHCHSVNRLLGRYAGSYGIKTGYTRAAGGCLASVARHGSQSIYLVIMHCTPVRSRFNESATLLDHGFAMLQRQLATRPQQLQVPYRQLPAPSAPQLPPVPYPKHTASRR